jgi:desulfoferrodoxin (superoxide reductase-like protein)
MEKEAGTMKRNRAGFFILILLVAFCAQTGAARANKSASVITVPESADRNAEITIRVTVTHSANSAAHHTEWLKVSVNGKEVGRWEFTSSSLPEGGTFTREIKHRLGENAEIRAEASCNVHGSAGANTARVKVKE